MILSRIGRATVIGSLGALAILGSTGVANAFGTPSATAGGTIAPGVELCTVAKPANYAAGGFGTATGDGAKFKLKNGETVVRNTPTRVNSAILDVRSNNGTFPGFGYYKFCATNTGTTPTTVNLNLYIDSQV